MGMQINSKIFKRKTGKSSGKWIVRISYFDEVLGRKVQKERSADRKGDAILIRNELTNTIQNSRGQIRDKLTFDQLADISEQLLYKPVVVSPAGKKLSGVRSIGSARSQIKNLRAFFKRKAISKITIDDLQAYKVSRMAPANEEQIPVKIATVNRELQTLRRMLRYAVARDWLAKSVFEHHSGLIESANEDARTRILSRDEEARLLDACTGINQVTYNRVRFGKEETLTASINSENPTLRAILLLAIDSGMRRGEILKLRWDEIDFQNSLVNIVGTHTKTEKARIAPLSERTRDALNALAEFRTGERPFPITDFKNSFTTAKRVAGIEDLRFHDLRRTAITRWIQAGTPLALAGKFAGHAKVETTARHYIATDLDALQELNARTNSVNSKFSSVEVPLGEIG